MIVKGKMFMKKLFKNYKSTIILIGATIGGIIIGLLFEDVGRMLKPLGDAFINLLIVIIVPLIFLTITTAIAKMRSPKRLGKIMLTTLMMFVITSLVAVFIGFVVTYNIPLVNTRDTDSISNVIALNSELGNTELSILERTVDTLTVDSFEELLVTDNIIALLVFSVMFGLAINMTGEKGGPVKKILESFNEVIMSVLKIIMYYAPIGIGAYAAYLTSQYGSMIAVGYLKVFTVYTVVAVLYYIIVYTIYAYIAGKKEGVVRFWKNALPATLTALTTCSSAASIPVNSMCAKKAGVSNDVAETVIPLGTSFHKDGSIIGSVFKIMFLVCLFGTNISSFMETGKVIIVSLFTTLLVTAVPIGGGTISEMMILTMMGYPVGALPILTIIATIIDPPATMLNVVGDLSISMMVSRVVDGKEWIKKESQ